MKTKILVCLAGSVIVLAVATAFQLVSRANAGEGARHSDLVGRLPVKPAGWKVTDRPIAQTPEMQKAVDEMLNYSAALFREYERPGKSLSVYVAYWEPRKFHPRLIAIHTPDVCWVGNGSKMLQADYDYAVKIDGVQALPAQYRLFASGGTNIHVLYWHVVSGRLSGYASGPSSASNSFLDNFIKDMREGAGEQFFIRISSPQPWSEWADDSLLKDVLKVFSPVLVPASSTRGPHS